MANLSARVTGLLREIAFSAVFGANAGTDAWNAALRVPQLLRELLAEGSLQNALVPGLARARETQGEPGAWALADAVLGALLAVLAGVTLLFLLAAPWLAPLLAGGFSPEKIGATVTLTRWLSPCLAGLSLAALASGALHARGRFLSPALASNALNLVVLAGTLAARPLARATGVAPLTVLALATTLSGFVNAGLLLPALRREGWRPRPHLRGHPRLAEMVRTLGPAIVGVATVQVSLAIETTWASGFGDGPLTWLTLAFRLVQLPLAVIAGTLATTALAATSAAHARGDEDAAGAVAADTLRLLAAGVLPCAVILGVLAEPIVALCFERGAFDAAATAGTARMLEAYAWATWGICLHRVLVPMHVAAGRTRLAAALGVGALALKVPVILLLTGPVGLGPEALPLSHAVTASLEAVGLLVPLRRALAGRGLIGAHARVAGACAAMGAVAWALEGRAHVLVACAAAAVTYVGAARLLGVRWRDRGPPDGARGMRTAAEGGSEGPSAASR